MPLPIKPNAAPLGECRGRAIRRFRNLEKSLYAKEQFKEFADCINKDFELGHAEPVPPSEVPKPHEETYYVPMYAVHKESSTTTKLRVVFDASAKTASGASLNDQFIVGPTVHSPLIDVLMRSGRHRIAMTTNISKMYRAVLLSEGQRDLHRFIGKKTVLNQCMTIA